MRHIGVIGAGHVGLVTAACFAKMGNIVICADNDIAKIKGLKRNQMPFYEPQLEDIVTDAIKKGRLTVTSSVNKLVRSSEIIFIAVGTPSTDSGEADLSAIENVIVQIAKALNSKKQKRTYKLIVEKSTVPVFTGQWVKKTLTVLTPTGIEFDVAANPEFLREGTAINDFLKPDRIVVGVESERAKRIFQELYKPLKAPMIFTDIKSAELIKHASNSFLATKISFINAISQICEKCGADIDKVAEGMGYDRRIGMAFLKAGIGYGGSCFPKDIKAFFRLAKRFGISFNLLKEVEKINRQQRAIVIEKASNFLNGNLKNKKICALGASFKPFTDDLRESPAVDVMRMLISKGAKVVCYDPMALKNLLRTLPDVLIAQSPYDALKDAELMLLLTEWPQFQSLDFKKVRYLMKRPLIIDGRNFLNPQYLKKLGFQYTGIGRKI
ncbi:MAG: UDP-glucose dehydrogenase family protein [Candidatus Ratteibacteria bacterium]